MKMLHKKDGVMSVEKSKIKLDMQFDARDVIDILVSEQEQNIENAIANCEFDLEKETKIYNDIEKRFQAAIKSFVNGKYEDKIQTLEKTFKEIGANATVRFEIIDGSSMVGKRPILISNPGREFTDEIEVEKIIVALVICNKDFDRNTVDNTISFYFESEFNDDLKTLNKQKQEVADKMSEIKKQIKEYRAKLAGTDRLVRRARAAVTKKAIGQDVSELLKDFRQQYPQIELKNG